MSIHDTDKLERLWVVLSLMQLVWFLPLARFRSNDFWLYVGLLVADVCLLGFVLAIFPF